MIYYGSGVITDPTLKLGQGKNNVSAKKGSLKVPVGKIIVINNEGSDYFLSQKTEEVQIFSTRLDWI
jgi:hypothetical protein